MSDIRALMIEALRDTPDLVAHRFIDTDGEWSFKLHGVDEVAERATDAILAAPGVTTIALPEPTSTREDDQDDESAHRLGWQNGSPYYITQWGYPNEVQIAYDGEALEPIDVNEARFLAAALLAAADAAEAVTDA
ncbi:hypothetical protein ACX9NE_26935 [Mycobacterium sp. ML4]